MATIKISDLLNRPSVVAKPPMEKDAAPKDITKATALRVKALTSSAAERQTQGMSDSPRALAELVLSPQPESKLSSTPPINDVKIDQKLEVPSQQRPDSDKVPLRNTKRDKDQNINETESNEKELQNTTGAPALNSTDRIHPPRDGTTSDQGSCQINVGTGASESPSINLGESGKLSHSEIKNAPDPCSIARSRKPVHVKKPAPVCELRQSLVGVPLSPVTKQISSIKQRRAKRRFAVAVTKLERLASVRNGSDDTADKPGKSLEKRMKNRAAVNKCRLKQKERLDMLELEQIELVEENRFLRDALQEMERTKTMRHLASIEGEWKIGGKTSARPR